MKKLFVLAVFTMFAAVYGADIYRGSSTSGTVIYNYSAKEKRLYRGASTSGTAIFTYEFGDIPKVYRGRQRPAQRHMFLNIIIL